MEVLRKHYSFTLCKDERPTLVGGSFQSSLLESVAELIELVTRPQNN